MSAPRPPQPMPTERPTALYLNGHELLTIQATPVRLADWAVGFLYAEGFIRTLADLYSLRVDEENCRVDADVNPEPIANMGEAGKRYLTSGCGKGVTFSSIKDALMLQPVRHSMRVTREQLVFWIKRMQQQTPLYEESGGMHAAAVVHVPTGEMHVREDIGRHNAVDKAIGAALGAGWAPSQTVVLTTGRISYEMCSKIARYGAGIGASLTAATDQACRLAAKLNVDLVGYTRSTRKMVLYTTGARLADEPSPSDS